MKKDKTPHVLLVDDEPKNLKLLGVLLKNYGYSFEMAKDGFEALEKIKESPPDLIFLDIMMPGMDGFEVCEKLKIDPETNRIPIVLLTSLTDKKSRDRGLELGASDFLSKPFDKTELMIKARNLIRIKLSEEALRLAKEKAEQATRLKDKFVALVAHDLKMPFTSLIGRLSLIQNDTAEPLAPKHKEGINKMLEVGKGLVHMIDQLLSINRLQTGNMVPQFKFFDGSIVDLMVKTSLNDIAEEKGIELVNEVPFALRLYADLDLFCEVIQNLVANAVKFCNRGDRVTLFTPPGRRTTVAVRDTGVGIPENDLPNLFKAETKTTTTGTTGEKGAGLGLPLCRDIMEACGGTISVESVEGAGSTFYAELPLVRPKILLVEDDDLARDMVSEILQNIGTEVIQVEDGKEAVAILHENTPHLIILDISMPEMDGFELLDYLKKTTSTRTIPVIMLTADDKIETRQTAFRKGANDFITKPLAMNDLIPRVRRFIF